MPDTRLQVFETEFHVHSSVLKSYSAFFAKFMNSTEKDNHAHAFTDFQYEWATKVDEDGSWALQSSISNTNINVQRYAGDSEQQASNFEKFLGALYFKSYSIKNDEELKILMEMGDYYRALPVVSQSLYRSFLRNQKFVDSIPSDASRSCQWLPSCETQTFSENP